MTDIWLYSDNCQTGCPTSSQPERNPIRRPGLQRLVRSLPQDFKKMLRYWRLRQLPLWRPIQGWPSRFVQAPSITPCLKDHALTPYRIMRGVRDPSLRPGEHVLHLPPERDGNQHHHLALHLPQSQSDSKGIALGSMGEPHGGSREGGGDRENQNWTYTTLIHFLPSTGLTFLDILFSAHLCKTQW